MLLRLPADQVEKKGMQRALKAINEADRILLEVDANSAEANGNPPIYNRVQK